MQGLLNKTDWNVICLDRLDFSGNLNRIADMLKDKEASVRRRLKYVWVDLRAPITEAAASDIGKVTRRVGQLLIEESDDVYLWRYFL